MYHWGIIYPRAIIDSIMKATHCLNIIYKLDILYIITEHTPRCTNIKFENFNRLWYRIIILFIQRIYCEKLQKVTIMYKYTQYML